MENRPDDLVVVVSREVDISSSCFLSLAPSTLVSAKDTSEAVDLYVAIQSAVHRRHRQP
jgi:hypothetical protein